MIFFQPENYYYPDQVFGKHHVVLSPKTSKEIILPVIVLEYFTGICQEATPTCWPCFTSTFSDLFIVSIAKCAISSA